MQLVRLSLLRGKKDQQKAAMAQSMKEAMENYQKVKMTKKMYFDFFQCIFR